MSAQQPLPPLQNIPPHLKHVFDYQQQAQQHLSDGTWNYLIGGAMHEISVQQNMLQFQDIQLVPRHLNDLTQGNTQFELFGQRFAHPIFLAPIGHQQLFHPQAELATAMAAEVMQSNYVLSTFTNTAMSDVNTQYPNKWFQLYWQGERELSLQLLQQAEQCGFKAIVVTIDSPHTGIRDRQWKSGFNLPENMPHPHTQAHFTADQVAEHESQLFQGLMKLAPTWDDILWLKQNTALPIILKGILHPLDAKKAVDLGIDGIIVSNHGGRVLDTSISPLTALQQIKKVIPQDYPVLLDGGIRRGSDIFKAIALGANAVLIGRPYIYGLATAGALGVAHVLRTLLQEFEITMGLMGTSRIFEINSDYIYQY